MPDPSAAAADAREKEVEALRLLGDICDLRAAEAAGEVDDYVVATTDGPRRLSSYFTEHTRLLLVHNMGVSCAYCAAYADGIDGVFRHLRHNVHVLVVSNDPIERFSAFAAERGWRLPVASIRGTSFSSDLGFEPEPGDLWPGMCAISRTEEGLRLENRYAFEPGDFFSPFWPLERFVAGPDAKWRLEGTPGE